MSLYDDDAFDENTTRWDGEPPSPPPVNIYLAYRKRLHPPVVETEYHDGSTVISDDFSEIPSLVFDSLSHTEGSVAESVVESMYSEDKSRILTAKELSVEKYQRKHPFSPDDRRPALDSSCSSPDLRSTTLDPTNRKRDRDCEPSSLQSVLDVLEVDRDLVGTPDQGGLTAASPEKPLLWPPMVILMNTQLEKGADHKWMGMTADELNDVKVLHSYGPEGNRGMSMLVYEPSLEGYCRSVDLHVQFLDKGMDRDAWEKGTPAVPRKLYGFQATGRDVDLFNNGCAEEKKVLYQLKTFDEVIGTPAGLVSEEAHQLLLDRMQQLNSARIKLIHAKLRLDERTFKEKYIRDKTVEGVESYEAARAVLVQEHEASISWMREKHQKDAMYQKGIHLDELVDREEYFAHGLIRDLMRMHSDPQASTDLMVRFAPGSADAEATSDQMMRFAPRPRSASAQTVVDTVILPPRPRSAGAQRVTAPGKLPPRSHSAFGAL